ncbi:MAG: ribonuclease III [Candidatus Ornithospirochaeta sp.]
MKAPSLTPERERELISFIEANKLKVKDLRLLNLAFTHTSYANECKGETDSYERLEFLGDAILDLITAEFLFENYYSEYHEGDFTKIKSVVVSEDSLSEIALQKHFEKYILIGKGEMQQGGAMKKAIQADVMEAVIAAVYLDCGMEEAREYVLSFIPFQIQKVLKNRVSYKDYKTKLQEYWQKKKGKVPEYTMVGHDGPDHQQVFHVTVSLGGKVYGPADGKSKKHAEQNVAKLALIHLGLEPNDGSIKNRE